MEFPEIRLLEEKIEVLVALVERLRGEKEALEQRLRSIEAENLHLQEQINQLQNERKEIRERIHEIVSKIERLETEKIAQGEL